MELHPCHTPYTETNSKWIVDLNVKAKSIKLLEEKIGINLCDLGLGKAFLDKTPRMHKPKEEIEILDFIRIGNFCDANNTIKKMKRQPTHGRKYL